MIIVKCDFARGSLQYKIIENWPITTFILSALNKMDWDFM